MEARIATALCLVIASALCGKALADGVRRRAKTLEAILEGLRILRVHMIILFEPVRDALQRSECPIMVRVAEHMSNGTSAADAWTRAARQASRRGGEIDALSREDRTVLDELFSHLGESGREEQEAMLNMAIESVEAQREGALNKAREADKLYLPLGLLTGLMLALVVI